MANKSFQNFSYWEVFPSHFWFGQQSSKHVHRCYYSYFLIQSSWSPSESSQTFNLNHKYNRDQKISLNYFLCKAGNTNKKSGIL